MCRLPVHGMENVPSVYFLQRELVIDIPSSCPFLSNLLTLLGTSGINGRAPPPPIAKTRCFALIVLSAPLF